MVPVSLRLKNFLSYREPREPLRFDTFQVACLSGANGHGKSALLDAMTWVLWGHARKRSGSIKPEEDLIHTGEREMEVEFVFDLEDQRYRVTRTFTRSATGKTRKTHLEIQVLDPETGKYRVLTGANLQETQERLNQILRIDYDTFVNSAFLLQGRSGEFTQRKPGERKEILARILNLERYEQLAERARQHVRELKAEEQQLKLRIEQLEQQIAPEETWKEQLEEVRHAVKEVGKEQEQQEQALREVREALVSLEHQAQRKQQVERELEQHVRQQERLRKRMHTLLQQMEDARRLLERAEAIQERYRRYEEVQAALTRQEEQFELYTGLKEQLRQQETRLVEQRSAAEKELELLQQKVRHMRQRLKEGEEEISVLSDLKRRVQEGTRAEEKLQHMHRQAQERQRLLEELEQIEREEAELRGRLEAEYAQLKQALEVDARAEQERAKLKEQLARLEEHLAKMVHLEEERERIYREGTQQAERCKTLEERKRQIEEEIREREDRLFRIQGVAGAVCPTCGTPLTEAHRAQVMQNYEEEIGVRRDQLARIKHELRQRQEERERLREAYRDVMQQVKERAELEKQQGLLRSQLEQREQQIKESEVRKARYREIEQLLQTGAFAASLVPRRQALQQAIENLRFDEAAYEVLKQEVARLEPLRERIRELERRQEEVKALREALEIEENRLQKKRRELDEGVPFRAIQDQIRQLERRIEAVQYQRDVHERLKREFRELQQAGAELMRLSQAQQHMATWKQEKAQLEEEQQQLEHQYRRLQEEQQQLEERLKAREAYQARVTALQERVTAVRERMQQLLAHQGELEERLRQCNAHRQQLSELRSRQKQQRHELKLYQHLQRAFGKHGIPSLIIEETLPDIERRANELLDRLTDGKTHVYLETLREKKKGGTTETLEIHITDEKGQARPYETYSGGEAFRVDFALRVALAQLLAERSGVRIRTLVIDEGFGTQDAEGRQHLVEAIRSIQSDFDKILVITHLEELKNAFPVRIQVWKDPAEGSHYEVVGV